MSSGRFSVTMLMIVIALGAMEAPAQKVSLVNAFPSLTFPQPVFLTHATDGSDRVFVLQQPGQIMVLPNDSAATSAKVFLTIAGKLSNPGGEEGLLGLAFHPDFAVNGYFYVNYTAPNPLRTVVARFKVQQNNPDKADSLSEFKIIEIAQPFNNHNGGMIDFGPDGYLYVGMGDGGSANDPDSNGQKRTVLLAKMLRIDVNDTTALTHYRIPPDNPYAGNTQGWREEIWAYGLRNPWRWSFDKPTGVLWVGDVGQGSREEVDILVKGGNYGWRIMEGSICRPGGGTCDTTGLIKPVKEYDHSVGNSITGGYVYRGYRRPDLTGAYIYADYGSGKIWMLRYDAGSLTADSLLLDAPFSVSSFGMDREGELYIVSYSGAAGIYRLAGNSRPSAVASGGGRRSSFHLEQNYPNPFNPSTVIRYELDQAGPVTLRVYDVLGRETALLVIAVQEPGRYTVKWNAAGKASGVYLCRLTSRDGVSARKMVLAK